MNPPIKDKCKLKSMFISLKFMYFKQNPQDFSKARDLGGNKLDIISGLQKIRKGKKRIVKLQKICNSSKLFLLMAYSFMFS